MRNSSALLSRHLLLPASLAFASGITIAWLVAPRCANALTCTEARETYDLTRREIVALDGGDPASQERSWALEGTIDSWPNIRLDPPWDHGAFYYP
jgi:hypothetical protein